MLGHNNLKDFKIPQNNLRSNIVDGFFFLFFGGGGSIYEIKKIPRLDGKKQLNNLDVGVGTGVFSPTNNLR